MHCNWNSTLTPSLNPSSPVHKACWQHNNQTVKNNKIKKKYTGKQKKRICRQIQDLHPSFATKRERTTEAKSRQSFPRNKFQNVGDVLRFYPIVEIGLIFTQ